MFREYKAEQADLIAAKATPDATSAIAVVRLSGRGASKAVEELMGLPGGRLSGRKRVIGEIPGTDRVVALSWEEGRSYTGEEMVEIMCHGTPGTTSAIMTLLLDKGARTADPGEFTRRAWLNGKVTDTDILMLSARFRNIPVNGTEELAEQLNRQLTETEALIEFGEEHEIADQEGINRSLEQVHQTAEEMKTRVEAMEILPRVFIMGPVNAGKSTLFNRLCGSNAAVVSSTPGTTRDGAVKTAFVNGRRVELHDSAGTGGSRLDGEALIISMAEIEDEDRVVWMDPCQEEPEGVFRNRKRMIKVFSRNDDGSTAEEGWITASALTGQGLKEIREFISGPEADSPSWRLNGAVRAIADAKAAWVCGDLPLAAEMLKEALETINEGQTSSAAVERALESFCIGK